MNLKTPILEVAGIGEAHAKLLEGLGIQNIEDFLWHLPRRWDDYSNVLLINQVKLGQTVSVRGKVAQIENKRIQGGRTLTQAIISDGQGLIKAVWFNQPFLTKNIHVDDELFLAGVVEFNYGSIQMTNPSYEVVKDQVAGITYQEGIPVVPSGTKPARPEGHSGGDPGLILDSSVEPLNEEGVEVAETRGMRQEADPEATPIHVGRIVPVYPETAGVTSKWLRNKIQPLMKYIYSIKDYLPDVVKQEEKLLDLPAAIRQMHFPENEEQLLEARERIDFDEMFLLQVAVLGSKQNLKKGKAIAVAFDEELIKTFVQSLGFELTVAQRKAAWDILQDVAKGEPMNRLLQGDVGSGKTVVAAMAMLDVAASGSQAVLLCPTEILAKQHYAKISNMLAALEIPCVLLTGSTPKAERIESLIKIREGEAKVIIGTHAILENNVEFWRLALAIVDEQHRFGLGQRAALKKESLGSDTTPHFLAMTATPIPRTLSLTVYGDLDVSIIYELPSGRQKVTTRIVPEAKRADSYEFIRKQVEAGRQVYVVCPLVQEKVNDGSTDDSVPEVSLDKNIRHPELDTGSRDSESGYQNDDKLVFGSISDIKVSQSELSENERKSVMKEYEKLSREIFKELKVGYIHGQMRNDEKELAMSKFVSGATQILVSSSVIEVGVDVPNASVIIIEDAERFGLAQLHQFRGRVGRGLHASYCLLFTSSQAEVARKRLEALVHTDNGFKLADTDLEIRGPGDYIGGRQHGLPDIQMRNFMNSTLITRTRESAKRLLNRYDIDSFPLLKQRAAKYLGVLNLE